MKTRFVCPPDAQALLRRHYHRASLEGMFSLFCGRHGYTDGDFRALAAAEGVTITEAVRRIVLSRHPEIGPFWRQRVITPAQLAGARSLARKTVENGTVVDLAVKALVNLLKDPDNAQARRRAREFVAIYGPAGTTDPIPRFVKSRRDPADLLGTPTKGEST